MKSLHIEGTDFSPKISYNIEKHHFIIAGFSRMENVRTFYQEVFDWIDNHRNDIVSVISPNTKLKFEIKLTYFNSSSSKCFLELFVKFKKLYSSNDARGSLFNIEILWYFEEGDEDMIEMGEDYSDVLEIPFTFVEYKSNSKE